MTIQTLDVQYNTCTCTQSSFPNLYSRDVAFINIFDNASNTDLFRKYCKKCRYKKCIESGMKPELVDASLRNREADMQASQGK